MIATCTPLGYTFGRVGNFINGELFGRVTTVPWGVVFPDAPRFQAGELWVREMAERSRIEIGPDQVLVNLARHPSQLYEAALEGLVLFAVLWFVLRKRALFPGMLFSAYLIGYGAVRFAVEYLRQPDPGLEFPIMLVQVANPSQISLLNFTTGQILSAVMIAAGITAFLLLGRRIAPKGSVGAESGHSMAVHRRLGGSSRRRRRAAARRSNLP